jgi:succinate dehydrogenase / fumarate reductase, membrane anchor subunit
MAEPIHIEVRRSQLGRARGAAKSGVHHWYAERVTAIALVPLTLWFVFSMIRLAGAHQEEVVVWVSRPWNSALLLALIAMTFHHIALGVQVVLEDYVNAKWAMNIGILATKGLCGLMALMAAMAVLKLALW